MAGSGGGGVDADADVAAAALVARLSPNNIPADLAGRQNNCVVQIQFFLALRAALVIHARVVDMAQVLRHAAGPHANVRTQEGRGIDDPDVLLAIVNRHSRGPCGHAAVVWRQDGNLRLFSPGARRIVAIRDDTPGFAIMACLCKVGVVAPHVKAHVVC